jgi:hypothetical protein
LFALAAPRAPRPTLSSPFEIEYAHAIGGSATELVSGHPAAGVAIARDDGVYIVGSTASLDFPLRDPWQHGRQGPFDAFVVKLDARGRVVYSTYLGGTADDYGHAIAVDARGQAYVAVQTRSDDFPGEPPPEGGAFVVTLDAQGFVAAARVVARGSAASADALAVDGAGRVHVAGRTGDGHAFVATLDSRGTATTARLEGGDRATAVAVDRDGTIHVVGTTTSALFAAPAPRVFLATRRAAAPWSFLVLDACAAGSTVALALDARGDIYIAGTAPAGGAFVEKRSATGERVYWKTASGHPTDVVRAIAVDDAGRVHVAGATTAPPQDAFLAMLKPDGSRRGHRRTIGGRGVDRADAVGFDASGAALLVGGTESEDFPVAGVDSTFPAAYAGGGDAFVVKLAPARAISAD